eukprot:scaffold130294_cov19-Tisochrysis_lutea.AAC.2
MTAGRSTARSKCTQASRGKCEKLRAARTLARTWAREIASARLMAHGAAQGGGATPACSMAVALGDRARRAPRVKRGSESSPAPPRPARPSKGRVPSNMGR